MSSGNGTRRTRTQETDRQRATLAGGGPETPRAPCVLVLGTGAMGSLLAAKLAASRRAEVTLAGSWAAALDTISAHGVVVHERGRVWSAPVTAAPLEAIAPSSADVVLVVVKSHQTVAVAAHAARALTADGIVVTLQNGLGNLEMLAAAAGAVRAVLGVTSMGATLLRAGHVADGGPGSTVLGRTEAVGRALADLVALFESAGVPVELRDDIDAVAWRKLCVNCAINPLGALLGVPNGRLLDESWTRTVMERAACEAGAVAAALGIAVGGDPAEAAFAVARKTSENRSSMLQDVARGVRTEIDAINGAVVREGRRVNVATPVNEILTDLVHGLRSAPSSTRHRDSDGNDTEKHEHLVHDGPTIGYDGPAIGYDRPAIGHGQLERLLRDRLERAWGLRLDAAVTGVVES